MNPINSAPEHCWKHCLGLEDSDGVLNVVEDKVERCDPIPVPDGEGGTLFYQQVNNLNRDILIQIRIMLFFALAFKMPKKVFCLFLTVHRYTNISRSTSGSVQIIKDPNPTGPKTYRTYESGSGSLLETLPWTGGQRRGSEHG
jgi:hypothetical protein